MKIRKPAYYDRFHCIAGACTDTCCAGWEIDIDEDSLEKYLKETGEFGTLLRKKIRLPDPESGEPAHFILSARDRCPFLNEANLCEIYAHMGEGALSQICTDHPRFYEWYADLREMGIGICCEEACRIILQGRGLPTLVTEEDTAPLQTAAGSVTGEPEADAEAEDSGPERELENLLFAGRERLFTLLDPAGGLSLADRENRLYAQAEPMQTAYEDLLFGPAESAEPETEEAEKPKTGRLKTWEALFWNPDFLRDLIRFYGTLDINDRSWTALLTKLEKDLPDLLICRDSLPGEHCLLPQELTQLLWYFLYRYYMKARLDDDVSGKVGLALLSVGMIELAALDREREQGQLSEKELVDLCKLYSKEIEYDEENVSALAEYFNEHCLSPMV